MNEEAVKEFIESNLAGDGRFRSLSQWAQAAQLTVSTLHGVRRTGRADPETLIKIGAPLGVSASEMFIMAGWLEEPQELTNVERDWLALFRGVPSDVQTLLVECVRALVSVLRQPTYQVTARTHLRIAERRDRQT